MMDASLDGAARGAIHYRENQIRIAKEVGDLKRVKRLEKQDIKLTPADLGEIAKDAAAEAEAFIGELEAKLRQVLRNNTVKGIPYDAPTIQRRLLAVLTGERGLIQPIQPSGVEFAAVRPRPIRVRTARGSTIRRPMRIGNRARYEAFQTRLASEKFERALLKDAKKPRRLLRMTAEERKADKARVKRLDDWGKKLRADPGSKAAQRGLARYQTRYTGWRNNVNVKIGLRDPDVTMFIFTLGDSLVHTDICLNRQGLTVRQNDPRLITQKPPLHFGCRSQWLPVTKAAAKEFKIRPNATKFKDDLIDNPAAEGF